MKTLRCSINGFLLCGTLILNEVLAGHLLLARSDNDDYGTLDEATADVKRQTRGRVLSAKEQGNADDRRYQIKVLTPEGRVKQFNVRPESRTRYPRWEDNE